MDVGFFYEELSPYGDWVYTRDFGWAWFPRNVHAYWRPYNDGRWVMTEYGWTWVSYEPFGWATYHYGRWAGIRASAGSGFPARSGVPRGCPGRAAEATSAGRRCRPQVGFQVGVGIQLGGFNLSVGIRPDYYNFVPERSFLEPRLSGYWCPTARNVTIIHNTTNVTNYTYIDNRVINRGIDVARIEQATGHRVQSSASPTRKEKAAHRGGEGEVRIYRPQKQKLDTVQAAPRPNCRASVPSRRPRVQPRTDRRRNALTRPMSRSRRGSTGRRSSTSRRSTSRTRARSRSSQRYQAQEKQKLEKLHQQELAKARAQSDRPQVEKRTTGRAGGTAASSSGRPRSSSKRDRRRSARPRARRRRQAAERRRRPSTRSRTRRRRRRASSSRRRRSRVRTTSPCRLRRPEITQEPTREMK